MQFSKWLSRSVFLLCSPLGLVSCSDNPEVPTADVPSPSVGEPAQQEQPGDPSPVDPGHAQMLEWLEEIRIRTPTDHQYLGTAKVQAAQAKLDALAEDASATRRVELLLELGKAEMELGHEGLAIERLTEADELLPAALGEGMDAEAAQRVTFRLAVAYMRLGETENCCAKNVPGSCILPFRGEAAHSKPRGSERATEFLTRVLQGTSPKTLLHMESRWLVNIAAMTLGRYPGGVPETHRIPPEAFAAIPGFPHFNNIATKMGLDTFSLSGGAIADDFDGDGHLDLVVSTWDTSGQLRYFRNGADGTFSEQTESAGLLGLYGGLNMVQADYDNDGDVDIFVLRGAWLFEAGKHPNSLLRNDGGRFTDVTIAAGLGRNHFPTQTASWGDYDLDGDLDLYVGNESTEWIDAPGQLWKNNGDGTFVDVASEAGVANGAFAKSVIWGDYDNDRYPDLFVSNYDGPNRLYHNQGDGTFVDVASESGTTEPIASFPAWFMDINNDGNLDLFVSAYASGIGHLASSYLGEPVSEARIPRIYHGNGKGRFRSVGERAGLVRPVLPMGSNFGDLDGDGFLDFFLGTGDPDFKNLMPNAMYMNRNGRFFMDVSTAGGFSHLQKGHAVVFADLDNDGDMDVFEQMGGAFRGDAFRDALYENPGFGNGWLRVQLVGVDSNRSAIGARLHLVIRKGAVTRSVYKHVNSGATFGGNPLRQTLGLGSATRIDQLEVFWPKTGKTQTFTNVRPNTTIRITEGAAKYETVKLPSYRLGG